MRKLHTAVRIGALGALFVLICAVYLVVLVNVQITGQDYYDIIKEETTTRYVKIAAKRGEIYDTNGKALVINTQIYDISLEYGAMPKQADAFNAVILDVLAAIEESGGAYTPVEVTFPFTGSFPNYEKDAEFFKTATNKAKYAALLRRLELDEYTAPEELFNFLRTRYGLSTYTKKTKTYTDLYDAETLETLMRIRFDMEYRQFSRVEPYTLARDVDTKLLTYVKERSICRCSSPRRARAPMSTTVMPRTCSARSARSRPKSWTTTLKRATAATPMSASRVQRRHMRMSCTARTARARLSRTSTAT